MYRGGYAVLGSVSRPSSRRRCSPGRFGLRSFLSLGPLVWIGRISYGLYLWHWPVIVAASPARTGLDGPSLTVVRVGLTFVFATAPFYLVEQPIRRGALPRAVGVGDVAVGIRRDGRGRPGRHRRRRAAAAYLQRGPNQLTSRASSSRSRTLNRRRRKPRSPPPPASRDRAPAAAHLARRRLVGREPARRGSKTPPPNRACSSTARPYRAAASSAANPSTSAVPRTSGRRRASG